MDKNKVIEGAAKLVAKGASTRPSRNTRRSWRLDPNDVRVLQKMGELYQKKKDNAAGRATLHQGRRESTRRTASSSRPSPSTNRSSSSTRPGRGQRQAGRAAPAARADERGDGLLPDGRRPRREGGDTKASLRHPQEDGRPRPGERLLAASGSPSCTRASRMSERGAGRVQARGGATEANNRPTITSRAGAHRRARAGQLQLARELAEGYLARGDQKRALAKLQLCFKADPRDSHAAAAGAGLQRARPDLARRSRSTRSSRSSTPSRAAATRLGDAVGQDRSGSTRTTRTVPARRAPRRRRGARRAGAGRGAHARAPPPRAVQPARAARVTAAAPVGDAQRGSRSREAAHRDRRLREVRAPRQGAGAPAPGVRGRPGEHRRAREGVPHLPRRSRRRRPPSSC